MRASSANVIRVATLPLAAVCVSVALGQPAGVRFDPIGDFEVFVDGSKDAEAQVYRGSGAPAVLVTSPRLPSAVLIHVQSRGVEAVPADRLVESGPARDLLRGDALPSLGSFLIEGSTVIIQHGDQELRLQPSPPLVGDRRIEELYAHSPEYRTAADAYEPDPELIAKLRGAPGDVRVRVVYGSWCSVCKQYLPRGLKVEEALATSSIRFEYFGLPAEDPWQHTQVKLLEVKALPTAVIFRGDEVVGRYAGAEQWESPELQLWEAISASLP